MEWVATAIKYKGVYMKGILEGLGNLTVGLMAVTGCITWIVWINSLLDIFMK